MKLVSFRLADETRLGLLSGERILNAASSCAAIGEAAAAGMLRTMRTFLNAGAPAWRVMRLLAGAAAESPDSVQWIDAPLAPPVPEPPKLICLAGNYAEHVRESGQQAAEKTQTTPRLFMKPPSTTLIAQGEPIIIPREAGWMDWEGELAIVIGRRVRHVTAAHALEHVAGYTLLNDVSERCLPVGSERKPREGDRWFDWLLGKWMDASAPLGPCLVSREDVPDPQSLTLEVRVNGALKQQSSTAAMVFSCAEIIAWISRYLTLEPGDIISTGTPAGVGKARGEWLQAGDQVEVSIPGIGKLVNPVIDERDQGNS